MAERRSGASGRVVVIRLVERLPPRPESLLAGPQEIRDLLERDGTISAGIDTDIHREEAGIGRVLVAEPPVHVSEEVPGTVVGLVPVRIG